MVPYFITRRRGSAPDLPVLIYAYGGFEIPVLPTYEASVGAAWLERGGAYVQANIRGGGEFGPRWWDVARKGGKLRSANHNDNNNYYYIHNNGSSKNNMMNNSSVSNG